MVNSTKFCEVCGITHDDGLPPCIDYQPIEVNPIKTSLLDQLESGPWPTMISDIKERIAAGREYIIETVQCPECGCIKKLSLDKGSDIRYTWCMKCQEAVVWEKLKKEIKDEG